MFGRKKIAEQQREINNLTAIIKNQTNAHNALEASEYQLMSKIREMDQLIFAMGQCTSWQDMQPIFLKLQDMTDRRMIEESKRIQNVLIPKMKKAYR